MLISLSVKNIALIDRLTVEFSDGLHVLTGETGAGKSILIDSISLLLGGKSSRELIRTGEKRAFVEGVFDISDAPQAKAFLLSQEVQTEDERVTLSREITESGRSVCRVDGLTWQLGVYQQLTAMLMDLHGQHAHQSLMDDKNHLRYLDQYGGKEHATKLVQVEEAYKNWHDIYLQLKNAQKMNAEKAERIDFLTYQKKEIEAAHLVRGEEEELKHERDMFRNADKISSRLENAYNSVYGTSPAAFQLVKNAARSIGEITSLDPRYAQLGGRLESAVFQLQDIGLTLRDMNEEIPSDPDRLDEIEERLDMIRRLSRKYGPTTSDMLDKLEEIEKNLQAFTNSEGLIIDLEKQEKKAKQQYVSASKVLTESRKTLASRFESAMTEQLNDLNMSGTQFVVSFVQTEPSKDGNEQVSFLISPNRGEKLQSLSKTASGGELSRLMLAIKSVGAEQTGIPSMIFDEIDTGISGRTAQKVAEKMHFIAKKHQVLCVTHLQQIAAMARNHYLVEKSFDGERTSTTIIKLDEKQRVDEIARMLGGEAASASVHAMEMLKDRKQ